MYVAFDTGQAFLNGDRAFDPDVASGYPGVGMWARLRELLRSHGYEVHTADIADRADVGPGTLLVSHTWSSLSESLIQRGAVPAVLFCLEVPVIAWEFYSALPRLAGAYRHVFLYRGARRRVPAAVTFHDLHWPYENRLAAPRRPLGTRGFLVMINSNKAVPDFSPIGWARTLADRVNPLRPRQRKVSLRYHPSVMFDPELRQELYSERQRAIEHFAAKGDFKLYGYGWDERASLPSGLRRAVARSYAGTVTDKIETLREYRFALCFENAVFPGCITEKIFDCFVAGCVPVYLGAPDVERDIPAETFVDARPFKGRYAQLEAFLRGMSDGDLMRKLDAASAFLGSGAFDRFDQERVAIRLSAALRAAAGETETAVQ